VFTAAAVTSTVIVAAFKTGVACSHTVYGHEGTAVHFYLAEPRRRAITVVPVKVVFSPVPFGVLTETGKLLCALLFPLGFKICQW
jgi:hypothetical protein